MNLGRVAARGRDLTTRWASPVPLGTSCVVIVLGLGLAARGLTGTV